MWRICPGPLNIETEERGRGGYCILAFIVILTLGLVV